MGAAPVETATAEPAPVNAAGPHTMRSLAESFIPRDPDSTTPSDYIPGIQITDLSRVRPIIDTSEVAPDQNEAGKISSALTVSEDRFHFCGPYWHTADELLDWQPLDGTGLVTQFWGQCSPTYSGDNVLVRGTQPAFDPAPERLSDLSGGLYTDLEGEDLEDVASDQRGLLPFQPTRIAVQDPDVFFTMLTPHARAWLDGDRAQAVSSDDRFMQVVDELDSHDVFVATIRPAQDPFLDLRESRDPNLDQLMQDQDQLLLIRQACERVGVGFSADDGGDITTHVVYQFPDEQTASAAFRSVADAWSSGWGGQGVPIEDVVETLHSVKPKGDLIVVTADVGTYGAELAEWAGLARPLACVGDA